MTLNLVDPSTRKNFETNVLLDQMSIKQGMKPNEDGTFTITLPKSNSVAKIRPLTFGEANEIESMADSYPQGRIAPRVTWKLQRQIVELNGITDKGELSKEIERMPITDSKYIKNFLLENEPRLDLKKTVTAPSGEKLTVNVGFGVEFFRPFF
jgi:hypothetical protein